MTEPRIRLTTNRCYCHSGSTHLCPTCRFLHHRLMGFANDILFVYGNGEEYLMEEAHSNLIWACLDLLARYVPRTRNVQRTYEMIMCKPVVKSVFVAEIVDSVCKRVSASMAETRQAVSRTVDADDEDLEVA